MQKYIVLLGPPGVGKGTQAEIIAKATGLPHISSGDLFRENLKNATELGKMAQSFMNKGELVPDDVTIGMIRDRLSRPDCKAGALLDGFPRTAVQAVALGKLLAEFGGQVSIVPYITASAATLVDRLSGRSRGFGFVEMSTPEEAQKAIEMWNGQDLDGRKLTPIMAFR